MENDKTTEAIRLKDISISFSGVKVLKKASFVLKRNEIHAIVGKNGAGKSSFMKVLTGVYTPDEGEVYISGKQIEKNRASSKAHASVAMVYQDLSLVPSLSVLQNIFLIHHPFRRFGLLQDKKARGLAEKILEQVGISHIAPERLVESLSAGEAQLVEIAKAISANPDIIVFDEPTASLSDIEIKALFDTIDKLRKEGLSIIYITHYLEDVMQICDRVTVLRNGEVISTNPTSKISIESIVSDMLGEEGAVGLFVREKSRSVTSKKKPLLEIRDAYTDKVGPITMKAYAGEIIGIAGLLGSGRTEILQMLYGLDSLRAGEMYIDGRKAHIKNPKQAAKNGITLVPEERRTKGLVLDFDVEENIAIPNLQSLVSHGMINPKKRRMIADAMIEKIRIKTTGRSQIVRLLSGGNQQKVVIAKCLASNPTILLLDDPTFGVDVHAKVEIMKIIKKYADAGNVVFFISSEFSELSNFCNRTYIVKKRKIVAELENTMISEEELLKAVQ